MSCYIVCPRCNEKIRLCVIENTKNITVACENCNTHIILSSKMLKKLVRKKAIAIEQSSPSEKVDGDEIGERHESAGENGKSQGGAFVNFLARCFEAGKKVYDTLNEEYSAADERLRRQKIDEWDEERLRKERTRVDIFEGAIIQNKLNNLRNSNNGEDDE